MNKETKVLLDEIAGYLKPHDFILVGGTALAFHLNHRESDDIDLATLTTTLNKRLIDDLIKSLGHPVVEVINPKDVQDFLVVSEDVRDYQQNYQIGKTKVSFFVVGENPEEKTFVKSDVRLGFLPIASVDSIFKMKSLLMTSRQKSRDLYDLYTLITHQGFTLTQLFENIRSVKPHYPEEIIKQRLAFLPMPPNDEGFDKQNPSDRISLDEIRGQFKIWIRNYEEAKCGLQPDLPTSEPV